MTIKDLKTQAFSDTGTYADAEALFFALRNSHLPRLSKSFTPRVWNEQAHNICINEAEYTFERVEMAYEGAGSVPYYWRIYFIPVDGGYHVVRVRYDEQVGPWFARVHRDDTCRAF